MKKFVITGAPGVGKTTLIRKLCVDLTPYDAVGFYTAELRVKGVRVGFELVGLHGMKGVLAHVDARSESRVGKYGVDVPGFEEFLQSVPLTVHQAGPVVIDEIGKMECLSRKFETIVDELMRADRVVVATVAWKGGGLISNVKRRYGAELHEITLSNRDAVYTNVRDAVLKVLRG